MEQIKLVIADLELILALLSVSQPNALRIKSTLDQATADLKEAARAITGQNPGGGET
jgi:hypothetical protein